MALGKESPENPRLHTVNVSLTRARMWPARVVGCATDADVRRRIVKPIIGVWLEALMAPIGTKRTLQNAAACSLSGAKAALGGFMSTRRVDRSRPEALRFLGHSARQRLRQRLSTRGGVRRETSVLETRGLPRRKHNARTES